MQWLCQLTLLDQSTACSAACCKSTAADWSMVCPAFRVHHLSGRTPESHRACIHHLLGRKLVHSTGREAAYNFPCLCFVKAHIESAGVC
jgi:hypothetical protein